MSELTDLYSKNFSLSKKKFFENRVRDVSVDMPELSAIQYVLAEMRAAGMKDGGIMSIDKNSMYDLESFAYGGIAKMLGE